jgi:hypothetical protein
MPAASGAVSEIVLEIDSHLGTSQNLRAILSAAEVFAGSVGRRTRRG